MKEAIEVALRQPESLSDDPLTVHSSEARQLLVPGVEALEVG